MQDVVLIPNYPVSHHSPMWSTQLQRRLLKFVLKRALGHYLHANTLSLDQVRPPDDPWLFLMWRRWSTCSLAEAKLNYGTSPSTSTPSNTMRYLSLCYTDPLIRYEFTCPGLICYRRLHDAPFISTASL